MTRLEDIAKAAGVSTAVVSRVASDDASLRISRETRDRVRKAISDLDYLPNVAAQSLKFARSGLVAVVVNDVSNPVYANFMRGAQLSAAKSGKALLICDSSAGDDSTAQLAKLIGGRGVDGLIIQSGGGIAESVLSRAAHRNVPTVLLQTELRADACLVMLPDEAASRLATRHLMELGHTEIGCIATGAGLTFTDVRVAGYSEELASSGMDPKSERVVYAGSSIAGGLEQTDALLERNNRITGLLCLNVMAAIGALEAIRRRGLQVPEDISLVAIHDIQLAEFLNPPLTTVAMPLFEMGYESVSLVAGGTHPATERIIVEEPEPRLVVRRSTSPPLK